MLFRSRGVKVEAHDLHPKYTDSLDACIPIVEKLDQTLGFSFENAIDGNKYWYAKFNLINEQSDKSPSLALSTALYHAIKELKK